MLQQRERKFKVQKEVEKERTYVWSQQQLTIGMEMKYEMERKIEFSKGAEVKTEMSAKKSVEGV